MASSNVPEVQSTTAEATARSFGSTVIRLRPLVWYQHLYSDKVMVMVMEREMQFSDTHKRDVSSCSRLAF